MTKTRPGGWAVTLKSAVQQGLPVSMRDDGYNPWWPLDQDYHDAVRACMHQGGPPSQPGQPPTMAGIISRAWVAEAMTNREFIKWHKDTFG